MGNRQVIFDLPGLSRPQRRRSLQTRIPRQSLGTRAKVDAYEVETGNEDCGFFLSAISAVVDSVPLGRVSCALAFFALAAVVRALLFVK
jgi:hypothetical protein